MRTIFSAALLFAASAAAAIAAEPGPGAVQYGLQFPAVSIAEGQGVNVVVTNALVPGSRSTPGPCTLAVSFFAGDGSQIGTTQGVALNPGTSAAIQATQPILVPLVSATVLIASLSDPARTCAIETHLEIYNTLNSAVTVSVPGRACLGRGLCVIARDRSGG